MLLSVLQATGLVSHVVPPLPFLCGLRGDSGNACYRLMERMHMMVVEREHERVRVQSSA